MIRKLRFMIYFVVICLSLQIFRVLRSNFTGVYHTETMASTIPFPSPVGGVPLPADFGPSIMFAALYGFLLPLLVYRAIDKKSRNILTIGTTVFVLERIVVFSLRAAQARNASPSIIFVTYMQVSFSLGFIWITQDLVNLLRSLLVNSSMGPINTPDTPSDTSDMFFCAAPLRKFSSQCMSFHIVDGMFQADQPRRRFWYRRFTDVIRLTFLAATVPGVVGNAHYRSAMASTTMATQVAQLRYASSSVALFLILVIGLAAVWAVKTIPRVKLYPSSLFICLCALVSSSAIYRLAVMYNVTTSLTSMSSSSLNTPSEKFEFYTFHILSEWLAAVLLLGLNVREIFDTGMFGDWRSVDQTQWERERKDEMERRRLNRKIQKSRALV